jgi:hypothetical protein
VQHEKRIEESMIRPEHRTHLRQTLGQIKAEIGALQQALENAPEVYATSSSYSYVERQVSGYEVDDYILKFRLGNVVDLAHHVLAAAGIAPKEPR